MSVSGIPSQHSIIFSHRGMEVLWGMRVKSHGWEVAVYFMIMQIQCRHFSTSNNSYNEICECKLKNPHTMEQWSRIHLFSGTPSVISKCSFNKNSSRFNPAAFRVNKIMPGVRTVGQDLSGSTVNKKCPECSRIKVMKF